jgi:hypothetical protein
MKKCYIAIMDEKSYGWMKNWKNGKKKKKKKLGNFKK